MLKPSCAKAAEAPSVALHAELQGNGGRTADDSILWDGNVETSIVIDEGETLVLSSGSAIKALYVIWDSEYIPGEWELQSGNVSITCGKDGYLHEFVFLPETTGECVLTFNKKVGICELYAYGEGDIPKRVQQWETLPVNADILVFVPHAGDEIIDFGAVEALYAGQKQLRVQVAYMCEYTTTEEKIKEHEMLDSLWQLGVKYYPVNGNFRNKLINKSAIADKFYGYGNVVSFVTENIRKFRPLVVVGPDLSGEYGNGTHITLANAVADSAENSADALFCAESAGKYGVWDVPKTYLHKYRYKDPRSVIFDINDGIRDLLETIYNNRHTDTWCGTHFSGAKFKLDDAAYFGLFRSTVGEDTMNDMTENVRTYTELALIEEREEAERQRREEYQKNLVLFDAKLKKAAVNGRLLFGRHMGKDVKALWDKAADGEWEKFLQ